jgi:hypothetical protein
MIPPAELLRSTIGRGFDKETDRVLEVPSLGLVLGVVRVVDVILDFRTEVQIGFIPGQVIASLQVILGRGLTAVVGQAVNDRVEPRGVSNPSEVPDAIGERDRLPIREVAVNPRWSPQAGDSHDVPVGIPPLPRLRLSTSAGNEEGR